MLELIPLHVCDLGEDLWDQSEQSVRSLRAPCRKPLGTQATCVITYACPCDGGLTEVTHLHGRLGICYVILRASLEQSLVGYQHTMGLATEPFSMDPMQKVQNRAMHFILGSFRTTPIHAMEVEASMPPICLLIDYINNQKAIAANHLHPCHPVAQ